MLWIPLTVGALAWAAPVQGGASGEITVSLFGQPCLLNGPVDKGALRAIHSISPEQVYPPEPVEGEKASAETTRKSLEKLRGAAGVPAALDRYRERLAKRLEAQLAFLEGLAAAKRAHRPDPLLRAAHPFLQNNKREKEFETLARGPEALKNSAAQLYEIFGEAIEADPEEEFHKAIQRLNVRYTCVFEEGSEETGSE